MGFKGWMLLPDIVGEKPLLPMGVMPDFDRALAGLKHDLAS